MNLEATELCSKIPRVEATINGLREYSNRVQNSINYLDKLISELNYCYSIDGNSKYKQLITNNKDILNDKKNVLVNIVIPAAEQQLQEYKQRLETM